MSKLGYLEEIALNDKTLNCTFNQPCYLLLFVVYNKDLPIYLLT